MFKMPQVGDHIELVDPGVGTSYVSFKGQRAVVERIKEPGHKDTAIVEPKFDDPAVNDRWWRSVQGGCYARRWKVIDESFKDVSRLVTRNGYKILAIHRHPDCIEATIKLRNRELTLHYGLTGRFYKGMECPVDLVEAK